MKIINVKYTKYSLKFKLPFKTSNQIFINRSGIIIKLISGDGSAAFGDAAPLPGFSNETTGDVINEIEQINKILPLNNIDNNFFLTKTDLDDFIKIPSLKFGFEQAVAGLLLKNEPVIKIFNRKLNTNVKVNGIVGLLNKDLFKKQFTKYLKDGYSTIKLKIGRKNFADDLRIIQFANSISENKIKLRLDVNGLWTYNSAVKYFEKLNFDNVEYVEQPVSRTEDLIRLAEQTDVQIAADESIININSAKNLIKNSSIKYFVVKPTLLGGIKNTLELIKLADENNKKIIISSSLESVVGWSTLVLLASLCNYNLAHGLATVNLFQSNLDQVPYYFAGEQIRLNKSDFPPKFNIQLPFN